jgi:hypothetical protein
MAKFTKKKKVEAANLQIVYIHALCKAIHHSIKLPKENIGLIGTAEEKEAINQLSAKVNYFIKTYDKIFEQDLMAKKYVMGNFNSIDEFSMQILEQVELILSKPHHEQNKH